jgi:ParB/RepB/Spo0J family partition protein
MTAAAQQLAPYQMLRLDQIRASPSNPRKTFAALDELAESVRAQGVLSPVLVRPLGDDFELVFGERRWRAARLAELEEIPAMVRAPIRWDKKDDPSKLPTFEPAPAAP